MMYAVLLLLSSWISLSAAILPGSVFPMKSFLQREQAANLPPPGSVFPMKSFLPKEQAANPPLPGSVFPMKSFLPREQTANSPASGSIFDVKNRQPLESVTPDPEGTAVHGTMGLAPKLAITPPPSSRVEKNVGDWFLVFRARSENSRPVAFSYLHAQGTNEENALPDCLSVSPEAKCNGNYRHSAIDRWRSIGVRRVKLELYKGSVPVAFIIFNGTNTQSTSWFNRKQILSSSWTDIRNRGNFFHFFGRKNERLNRRLFINKATSSCKDDEGWLIVVEDKGECPYDTNAKYPIFLYSDHSRASLYEDHGKQAEVLAIYVDAENLKQEY